MTKELREGIANIIAKGRKDECISLDIAERIIIYLHSQGGVIESKNEAIFHHGYFPAVESLKELSSPPTFRDGSTLALAVHSEEHEYPGPMSIEWPYLPSGDDLRFQTGDDPPGKPMMIFPFATWGPRL